MEILDINGNNVYDGGDEYLELKLIIRIDRPHLIAMGDMIRFELETIRVRVNAQYVTGAQVYYIVMINRDFHLYIGAYSCPDPTYLYWAFHSSMIPTSNYNSISDIELDQWLAMLIFAATQNEAVNASHNAQQAFVDKCFKVPLWSYLDYKAMYRKYTGGTAGMPVLPDDGENQYRNQYWQGAVNIQGSGIDNFWSFLNMHPTGFAYGHNDNMTIRWGFSVDRIYMLNPIYAEGVWDWKVLDLIYNRLIRQEPYSSKAEPEWIPWIAKNFTVGTYEHPMYGECTKVNFTLRTDVTWQDGTPLTTADVYFTLVELSDMLIDLGYPPWWYSNVAHILDFKVFDPYNFEVLFDYKSTEELYYESVLPKIADTPILPKHIWKPIVETGDPQAFAPDPNMIGSGPWRLKEYGEGVDPGYILLVANKPGSEVQTNLSGSEPITSPNGYFQFYPVYAVIHFKPPHEYRHKIPLDPRSVEFKVTLENLIREHMIVENTTVVDLSNPIGSGWNETWPIESIDYFFSEWIDNGDGVLNICDIIALSRLIPPTEWYHVEEMWWKIDPGGPTERHILILELKPIVLVNKFLYIDDMVEEPTPVYLMPKIPHEQQRLFQVSVGLHSIVFKAHIKEPNWDSWRLYCRWVNYTFMIWVTIKEDIVGSTLYDDIGLHEYPYKIQAPLPDFKVDIKDIAYAAKAFGSYPGHERWSPFADISCDYKIDIRDIAMIASKFGWSG